MDVFVRVLFISKKIPWPLEKAKSRQQKNNEHHKQGAHRPAQSGVHTAQHILQQPEIPQPVYISAPSVGCG